MRLKRYKVENFRSVHDSGWIDCDNVTTLVGINEAGKSNLLLALWKLKPAREGSIDTLHDMPVSKLSSYRKTPENIKFITAEFELDDENITKIESTVECNLQGDKLLTITRFYDGHYTFEFPSGPPISTKIGHKEEEGNEEAVETETIIQYEYSVLEEAILNELPSFVYYSNYGNLSSKIYLPNVIKWLNGQTVDGIDINEEQVRTLRVLFEFVKLDPKEILELGKDQKKWQLPVMERIQIHNQQFLILKSRR